MTTLPEFSARLGLPFLQAAQAQKHVTLNEALLRLDTLVHLTLEGLNATTPPAVVEEGMIWALGGAPSGPWVGNPLALAVRVGDGWEFILPAEGWRATLRSSGAVLVWTGSDWQAPPLPADLSVESLGVNASADTTNRLTVASEASLLTHAGAGHQVKINKAGVSDTASLLYQSGWSGRAEIGLAGSDDLSVKVSPDGATWVTGLLFSAATGQASCPAGLEVEGLLTGTAITQSATDTTEGRITKTGDFGLGLARPESGVSVSGVYLGAPDIAEGEILLLCKARTPGTALRGEIVSHHALGMTSAAQSGWRARLDHVVAADGTRRSSYDLQRLDAVAGLELVQFRLGGTDYLGLRSTLPGSAAPLAQGHLRFSGTLTPDPLAFTRIPPADLDSWDTGTDTPDGAIYDGLAQGDPVVDRYGKGAGWAGQVHLLNEAEIMTRRSIVGDVAALPDADGLWQGAAMSPVLTTPEGAYLRLANGFQLCLLADVTGVDVDIADGALFRSADIDLPLPAAFTSSESYAGSVSQISGDACLPGLLRPLSASSVRLRVHAPVATTGAGFRVMLTGLWT